MGREEAMERRKKARELRLKRQEEEELREEELRREEEERRKEEIKRKKREEMRRDNLEIKRKEEEKERIKEGIVMKVDETQQSVLSKQSDADSVIILESDIKQDQPEISVGNETSTNKLLPKSEEEVIHITSEKENVITDTTDKSEKIAMKEI